MKLFFLNILMCLTLLGNTQAAPVAGRIDHFNCIPEVYTLIRNGQSLPVEFYTELQKGDQVAINTDKNALSLKLRYEQKIPLVKPQAPYTVVAPPLSIDSAKGACSLDAYTIKRNGKSLPIPPRLLVNDQIVADKTKPSLQLTLGETVIVVNHQNSPYTVIKAADQPSNPLLAWIGQTITQLHTETFKSITDLLKRRGIDDTPSTMPAPYTNLLKKRKHRKLVAGTRPLYLAWKGGKAPYDLTIKRANQKLLEEKGLKEQRIKTPVLDLTVGDYRLRICDAQKKCSVDYAFSVVESKPEYPRELKDSRIPEATRLTAQATWLAAQGRKKWFFEAYQQIAGLSEPSARIVRDALEQGARIKLPKRR